MRTINTTARHRNFGISELNRIFVPEQQILLMEETIKYELQLEIEAMEQLLSDRREEYDRMKEEHLRDYPDQGSELAWEMSQHLTDYHRFYIAPLQEELEEKKRTFALFS